MAGEAKAAALKPMVSAIIFFVALGFALYFTFGGSGSGRDEVSPDLKAIFEWMTEKNPTNEPYDFIGECSEARGLSAVMEAADIDCGEVLKGRIYPFPGRRGFEADVYCATGGPHMVNYKRDPIGKLFVNGASVEPPKGWR
jgi:hypothetical protein